MKITKNVNKIMRKRVTIIFDDDIMKKLYELQSKQLKASSKSVSMSDVINELLRKALK